MQEPKLEKRNSKSGSPPVPLGVLAKSAQRIDGKRVGSDPLFWKVRKRLRMLELGFAVLVKSEERI